MKKKGFALIIVEIHEFPKIVQSEGFCAITQLSEMVKSRLSSVEIKEKTIFKVKDNIFAVLLSGLPCKTQMDRVMQTLQHSLQFTLHFPHGDYMPLYSMGAAFCEQANVSSKAILSTAFSALDEIKTLGYGYNRYYLKNCQ